MFMYKGANQDHLNCNVFVWPKPSGISLEHLLQVEMPVKTFRRNIGTVLKPTRDRFLIYSAQTSFYSQTKCSWSMPKTKKPTKTAFSPRQVKDWNICVYVSKGSVQVMSQVFQSQIYSSLKSFLKLNWESLSRRLKFSSLGCTFTFGKVTK